MIVVRSFAEARLRRTGRVALVPTMGFLHEGHLSLIRRAREEGDTLMVSVFVNPLQFDRESDLERYPRDLVRDAELCEDAGVDVVFAPDDDEVYPTRPLTRVRVSEVGDHMEGPHRPGHFEGVATVVAKLFAGLRPDVAAFGRKDAQQLALVSTMARDLSFPVEIVGGSTVREADGLALSSRNVFLSAADRQGALTISQGLMAAADAVESGERRADALEAVVAAHLGGVEPEYVALAAQGDARPLERLDRPAFLAVAAVVPGGTRLIDNVAFDLDGDLEPVADRGHRLDRPSLLYRSV